MNIAREDLQKRLQALKFLGLDGISQKYLKKLYQ